MQPSAMACVRSSDAPSGVSNLPGLRRDVDPEKECRECFVMAAALVAASTLLSAQAQGVTDFDAGQVSLRLKDPGDSMVRGALYMLTPWMEPDTCFMGVRA